MSMIGHKYHLDDLHHDTSFLISRGVVLHLAFVKLLGYKYEGPQVPHRSVDVYLHAPSAGDCRIPNRVKPPMEELITSQGIKGQRKAVVRELQRPSIHGAEPVRTMLHVIQQAFVADDVFGPARYDYRQFLPVLFEANGTFAIVLVGSKRGDVHEGQGIGEELYRRHILVPSDNNGLAQRPLWVCSELKLNFKPSASCLSPHKGFKIAPPDETRILAILRNGLSKRADGLPAWYLVPCTHREAIILFLHNRSNPENRGSMHNALFTAIEGEVAQTQYCLAAVPTYAVHGVHKGLSDQLGRTVRLGRGHGELVIHWRDSVESCLPGAPVWKRLLTTSVRAQARPSFQWRAKAKHCTFRQKINCGVPVSGEMMAPASAPTRAEEVRPMVVEALWTVSLRRRLRDAAVRELHSCYRKVAENDAMRSKSCTEARECHIAHA